MSYTKLFHRIITSSIWDEPNPTRIVWVTMLALANQDGYVGSTLKSLAMLSRVTEKECQVALDTFLNPDRESRSPENDGRRIERVEGGWVLLNYEKHRNAVSDDPSAIANRERQKRYRALHNVTKRDLASASASVSAFSGDRGGGEGERTEPDSLPHTLPDSLQRLRACPELRNLTARQWQALRAAFATMEPGPESEAVLTMLTRLAAIEAKDGQIEKPGTWIKFKLNDLSMGKIGVDGKGKGGAGGGERPPTYEEQRRAELRIAAGYPA